MGILPLLILAAWHALQYFSSVETLRLKRLWSDTGKTTGSALVVWRLLQPSDFPSVSPRMQSSLTCLPGELEVLHITWYTGLWAGVVNKDDPNWIHLVSTVPLQVHKLLLMGYQHDFYPVPNHPFVPLQMKCWTT